MNVKLTTETARRSALILKETTHVPVLRVLWTQVQMELMLSALTLVRISFFFPCLLLFLPGYFIIAQNANCLFWMGGLFLSLTFLRKMFIRLVTSVGQRKESPEESNLRPSDSALRCSTTEPQRLLGERGLLRSSYDTRPNLVVVRLVFYCPIFFCLFLFCFVFFVASVEELYQILTAQSETWFPTLSLLFLWSLLSLYAFHRRVFWWDTPVWQSREMPQHSR